LTYQKSHEIRGDFPVSALGGKALALVMGILHRGQAELKQYISGPYFMTQTAPVGLVPLLTKRKAPVSSRAMDASSFGSMSTFWLVLIQFRLGPIPALLEDDDSPPPFISFLKDRPFFIVMVDLLVVTPSGEYAFVVTSKDTAIRIAAESFMMMIVFKGRYELARNFISVIRLWFGINSFCLDGTDLLFMSQSSWSC
jgi:hypothetical protein